MTDDFPLALACVAIALLFVEVVLKSLLDDRSVSICHAVAAQNPLALSKINFADKAGMREHALEDKAVQACQIRGREIKSVLFDNLVDASRDTVCLLLVLWLVVPCLRLIIPIDKLNGLIARYLALDVFLGDRNKMLGRRKTVNFLQADCNSPILGAFALARLVRKVVVLKLLQAWIVIRHYLLLLYSSALAAFSTSAQLHMVYIISFIYCQLG